MRAYELTPLERSEPFYCKQCGANSWRVFMGDPDLAIGANTVVIRFRCVRCSNLRAGRFINKPEQQVAA